MKKITLCLLITALLLSFTSCASSSGHTKPTTLSDGSRIYYSGDRLTYSMNTIPFNMLVEGKGVPFANVSFFETHEDHGYTACIVAALDRSALSDDDVYWLTKYDNEKHCKTVDMNVYIYSDKNNLKTECMTLLGIVYDDNYIYFSFCSEKQRYSFIDSRFSCQVIIIPTGLTESDTVYYYYDHHIDENSYSDTIYSLSAGELNALEQALDD